MKQLKDWENLHPSSYKKAVKLGLTQQIAKILKIKTTPPVNENKLAIKEFYEVNKVFPNKASKNNSERRLGVLLYNYTRSKNDNGVYCHEIDQWARSLGYGPTLPKRKIDILNYFQTYSLWPNKRSQNTHDKSLGGCLCSYISKTKRCYDLEFVKQCRELDPTNPRFSKEKHEGS